MEREGRLGEAEQLFLLVNEPDQAISMYKKARQVSLSLSLSFSTSHLFHSNLRKRTLLNRKTSL